jgi:hypothetical protein
LIEAFERKLTNQNRTSSASLDMSIEQAQELRRYAADAWHPLSHDALLVLKLGGHMLQPICLVKPVGNLIDGAFISVDDN